MTLAPPPLLAQTIEWRADGVRFELSAVPDDVDAMLEWSTFWAQFQGLLDASDGDALNNFVATTIEFAFSSKAYDPQDQSMFSAPVHIEGSIAELGGNVRVDVAQAAAHRVLVVDICLQLDVPLALDTGAAVLHRLLQDDPMYVWNVAVLTGPALMPPDLHVARSAVFLLK